MHALMFYGKPELTTRNQRKSLAGASSYGAKKGVTKKGVRFIFVTRAQSLYRKNKPDTFFNLTPFFDTFFRHRPVWRRKSVLSGGR